MGLKSKRFAAGALVSAFFLASCDGVYVGASVGSYPYDDAFYWNDYYCCGRDVNVDIDVERPDRPDRPDRPNRPDGPVAKPLPAPAPGVNRPSRPPSVSKPINRPSGGGRGGGRRR